MKFFANTIAFLLVLTVVAPAFAQLNQIDGEWTITEGMVSGQEVPAEILSTMLLKISKGTFDAKSGETMSKGKITNGSQSSLGSQSSPQQIVFKINNGADAGRELKAIYMLKNKISLKIAFSQSDEFPEEFTSTKENRNLVLTYKNNAASKRTASRRGKNVQKAQLSGYESPTVK